MSDFQSAQSAYDIALEEYQKLLNQPQGNGNGIGNVSPLTGHNSFGGYIVDSWRKKPQGITDTSYLNGSRGRLDSARSALEAARQAQQGKLQPYVNRMTQNASNALYGGLLNYKPQSLVAGDAGGTPVNSTAPTGFELQSALKPQGGGLLNFGNRAWMNK